MIVIENTDSTMWNIEYKTAEIIKEIVDTGSVTISTNGEGPDLTAIGLYALIDHIVRMFPATVSINTCNLLEHHETYNIAIKTPFSFVKMCKRYASLNSIPNKDISKTFGLFVGRSNWQRLWLASKLHTDYRDKTLLTYHYDYADNYFTHNLGFDVLCSEIGPIESSRLTSTLLASVPIRKDSIVGYPVDGHKPTQPSLNAAQFAKDYFVEIVCETYITGKTFFPTEKTWRPIMCKTPFMIQGPQNFLANLKKLGFKTFDKWWDESYDYQIGKTSIELISVQIDKLSKLSASEMKIMYNDMLPTLEHNYKLLMTLTEQQMAATSYVK